MPAISMTTGRFGVLAGVLAIVSGCGYRAVYGGEAQPFHVKVVKLAAVDAEASDEVASGLREELARGGAVEAGEGYPRVEIEVLRTTEASEGIADVGGSPEARATAVGITARAWVVRAAGGAHERDTGDVRAAESVNIDERAGMPDPRADVFHVPDARRAAARRLGHALGRRILGVPAGSEEAEP
jgi:hypothetical protein